MDSASPSAFGALLRRYRRQAGLSVQALAERAGLSLRGVSDLERGVRRRPYPDTVRRLADALRLAAADRIRFVAASQPSAAAPHSPPAAPATTLPSPLTSFIGREQELADITDLLRTTRLLTLTGAGGVGKTRLALEAAARSRDEYADGVWLVELAALSDPGLAPQVVGGVLGVREQPGQALLVTLINMLGSKQLLLLLDNCEHLLDACAHLAEALLRGGPRLRILATSREALNIAGEVSWRVPALSLPDARRPPPAEPVGQSEAVRLFVARARAVQPRFALTDRNAAAVVEICRRLDGLPLAIELAAARVRALPVEEVAARLDDRFRLLTGGSRTALPRQQTLRAIIDWSHDLLVEAERLLLRRLAVFAGGWTLAAAEAVCAEDTIDRADVLDLLARLVDKSLVQVEEQGGEARYRLLETVRQYAQDRLTEAGEGEATRAGHAAWCLALAERAAPALGGPEQLAWLARLDAEHDNLRAALTWCLEHDAAAGLRLAGWLWPFWRGRRYYREGRGWLERLLDRTPAPTRWRAKALLASGRLAFEQGDLTTAQARLAESLALSRELAEAHLVAWTLCELANVSVNLGERARARSLIEEGLARSRAIGDPAGLAATLITLGRIEWRDGAYRRARAALEEGLALARMVGDRWLIGDALGWLGQLAQVEGDYQQARALGEEALAVAEELGVSWAVARLRWQLACAALDEGDHARAAAVYAAGLAAARQRKDTHWLAWHLVKLGRQAQVQGDAARATTLLEEGLDLFTAMADKLGAAEARHSLGLAVWQQGDTGRATALLRESLAAGQAMGDPQGIARSLEALAAVAADAGRAKGAARWLGAAEAVRRTIGMPLPPVAHPSHQATVAALRTVLGEAAFTAAWAEGRARPLEQAIAEALGEAVVPPPAADRPAPAPEPCAVAGLSPREVAVLPHQQPGRHPGARDVVGLSPREVAVLRLVAAGRGNQEIAAALSLSVRSVERHLTNLYGKLQVRGRAEATAFAVRHDLV